MRANLHVCAKKLLLSLAVCTAMIAPNAGADNAMRNIFNGMMTTTSPASFRNGHPYRCGWRLFFLPHNKREYQFSFNVFPQSFRRL